MVSEVPGQHPSNEHANSRERRKCWLIRIHRLHSSNVRLGSGDAQIGIDVAKHPKHLFHRRIVIGINGRLTAAREFHSPFLRAERAATVQAQTSIAGHSEMADQPTSGLCPHMRLKRTVRVIEADEDAFSHREKMPALSNAVVHAFPPVSLLISART